MASSSAANKRRRSEEEEEESSSIPMELNALNEKAIGAFLDLSDAIESLDPTTTTSSSQVSALVTQASLKLLEIKSLQRKLFIQLKNANRILEEKRNELDTQSLRLENLDYEKSYLQSHMETNVTTPQLERICREETSSPEGLSTNEMMNQFLCGSKDISFADPAQYQTVLTKLHKELNLRGSLERDAVQAQKELAAAQEKIKQNQQFLRDLPKKLEKVEKASLPLQRFFQQQQPPSTTQTAIRIGTERKQRLDMARSLPGPLYTLFVQLQSYLDSSCEQDRAGLSLQVETKRVAPTNDETMAWFVPDEHVVRLSMPSSSDDSVRSKQVMIEFLYMPKLRIVTSIALGSSDKVNLATLLVNLFPGDSGSMIWSAACAHLEAVAPSLMPGRPYNWCNYLAGVHLPWKQLDPLTTKVIVSQLRRRLLANTTLTQILAALSQKRFDPLPVHPLWTCKNASETFSTSTAKLVAWTPHTIASHENQDEHVKSFVGTIQSQSSTLKARVTVDLSCYPSVPPKWSLMTGEESWGEQHGSIASSETATNPLYDNRLCQMETKVNTQLDDFAVKDVEETYNWVLPHQLDTLLKLWAAHAETDNVGQQAPRAQKGRDRASVS